MSITDKRMTVLILAMLVCGCLLFVSQTSHAQSSNPLYNATEQAQSKEKKSGGFFGFFNRSGKEKQQKAPVYMESQKNTFNKNQRSPALFKRNRNQTSSSDNKLLQKMSRDKQIKAQMIASSGQTAKARGQARANAVHQQINYDQQRRQQYILEQIKNVNGTSTSSGTRPGYTRDGRKMIYTRDKNTDTDKPRRIFNTR